jgi:hypothetical protein
VNTNIVTSEDDRSYEIRKRWDASEDKYIRESSIVVAGHHVKEACSK